MKESIRKNFIVILAFSLPFILIAVVAISVYIPKLMVSTSYNFVYATCSDNYYYSYSCNDYLQKKYTVLNGKIVINDVKIPVDPYGKNINMNQTYTTHIFVHDTVANESREISIDEALQLNLANNLLTSPDGVTISSNYDGGGDFIFPFGGNSSSYGYYLTKGKGKSKLNLINSNDRYYYQNNFQVLGWVSSNK